MENEAVDPTNPLTIGEKSGGTPIDMEILHSLERIIFNLSEENLMLSVQQTMKLFDNNFSYSLNIAISNLVYCAFCSQKNSFDMYLCYLKSIQTKEDEITKTKVNPTIIEVFVNYISEIEVQEAYYLIEKFIDLNLADENIANNNHSLYFSHRNQVTPNKNRNNSNNFNNPRWNNNHFDDDYDDLIEDEISSDDDSDNSFDDYSYHNSYEDPIEKSFYDNYEELSKNDFELHKRYVKEGVNPSEIAKILRNDEIENLQDLTSQPNFDFNQKIEPSLYERCSYINQQDILLINYAAFFGSAQCFKYLLMNGSKLKNTGKYAIAGGNHEIIHLCEQNHATFKGSYETAIKFHRNEIFYYLYENELDKLDNNDQQNPSMLGNRPNIPMFPNRRNFLNFNHGVNMNHYYAMHNPHTLKPTNDEIKPKNLNKFNNICINSGNYEILSFLEEEGMKINESSIIDSARIGNLFLLKHFLSNNNKIPKNILVVSLKSGNPEIVKYVLELKGIDINVKNINLFLYNV